MNRVVRAGYQLLGPAPLLHGWSQGSARMDRAHRHGGTRAAAAIHTDFERGFIRAEVVSYDDFSSPMAANRVRAKLANVAWKARTTSSRTGDVVHFRFNRLTPYHSFRQASDSRPQREGQHRVAPWRRDAVGREEIVPAAASVQAGRHAQEKRAAARRAATSPRCRCGSTPTRRMPSRRSRRGGRSATALERAGSSRTVRFSRSCALDAASQLNSLATNHQPSSSTSSICPAPSAAGTEGDVLGDRLGVHAVRAEHGGETSAQEANGVFADVRALRTERGAFNRRWRTCRGCRTRNVRSVRAERPSRHRPSA